MRSVPLLMVAIMAGCASHWQQVDFERMTPVREQGFPTAGTWLYEGDVLVNAIPAGISREDMLLAQNGAGISMSAAPGLEARDVAVESEMEFRDTGAPSILLRVQQQEKAEDEQACVVTDLYSVAVHENGVILWRLNRGQWIPLYSHVLRVEPGKRHVLRAEARGDTIRVCLDGALLFTTRDRSLLAPGLVGVCGREGPCRFYSLAIRSRKKLQEFME